MMGEHLLELDPEEEIVESFACFDDGDKGVVDVKEMRKHLGELGDRMEDWEVGFLCFFPQFTPRTSDVPSRWLCFE
jgi:myosin regulatory light chain 12